MKTKRKKAVFACCPCWGSTNKVGSQHLATRLVAQGYEIAYVSVPISPFHIFGGNYQDVLKRYSIYKNGGRNNLDNNLWSYVPCTLLSPHNKPILRSHYVHRNWSELTYPNIINVLQNRGFGDVDLLYCDTSVHFTWVTKIKAKKSVFRVADYNLGFSQATAELKLLERDLAKYVDMVVYSAHNLESYIKSLNPKSMHYLPNGVNFLHFSANQNISSPREYNTIKHPIVLYVGLLEFWFDFKLVNELAKRMKDVSFVIIGPNSLKNRLVVLPNLHILGARDYDNLPQYMHNANVGIIPFNVNRFPDLIHNVNPLKVYEYMASGLPVVSTRWSEMERIASPAILCSSLDEFESGIRKTIENSQDKQKLIKFAESKDWGMIANQLLDILELA